MLVFVGSAGKGTPYLKFPERGEGTVSCYLLDGTGKLSHGAGPYAVGANPSCIVAHCEEEGHQSIFVTSETYGASGNSAVLSMEVDDTTTGALRFRNSVDSGGRACCHMVKHPGGGYLSWANYLGEASDPANRGTLRLCQIDATGMLKEVTAHIRHEGVFPGANKGRQEAPHVHGSIFMPMEDGSSALLVTDLGCDKIFQYIISKDGKAVPNTIPSVSAHTAGAGPRHLVAHPSNAWVYVVNELTSTIQCHSYHCKTGTLSPEPFQTIAVCAKDGTIDDSYSACAAIKAHPSGNFLYASNRGEDSIAIFRIGSDGKLTIVGHEFTGGFKIAGMGPRDFAISPCGSFLVAANQDIDTLTVYRINADSGTLTKTCGLASVTPISVCIVCPPVRASLAKRPRMSPLTQPTLQPAGSRFSGKHVLVTGGYQGIGRGIAEAFASEGAKVVVADIKLPSEGDTPGGIRFVSCDAAEPADIERVCAQVGAIDVLVNNVAVQPEGPCHEHSLAEWNKALAINLTSYFVFAKHLLPHMIKQKKGAIINIGSVQGSQSQAGIPGYASSKGGVLSLTRQLAMEYASQGIRVNSVSPGTIATPLVENILKLRRATWEQAGAQYPMKRVGQVDEVAKVVLFLASDDASFVTAENFHVDGGIMGLGGWAQAA